MKSCNIRNFQEKDRDTVKRICYATSNFDNSEKSLRKLYLLYCDYYIDFEPENCFVAVDHNDNAVGYIFCSDDFKRYEKIYRERYMSKLTKASLLSAVMQKGTFKIGRSYYAEYPAHLHIDILDGYQRLGLGHRLMDALITKLKQGGVKGVYLGCSAKNKKGCNFYEKYGFSLIENKYGCNFYGLKLN